MANIIPILKVVLVSSVFSAFGCGPAKNYTILTCRWTVDGVLQEKTFCYHDTGVCNSFYPSSQEFCAWNVFHSEAAEDVAKFGGVGGFAGSTEPQSDSCLNDGSTDQESKDFPPSTTPKSSCNAEFEGGSGGGGGGGSSASATVPTTGGETGETTDDTTSTTDTTGGGEERYFCSTQSPWKCANVQPDNALVGYPTYPDPYVDANDSPHYALWDTCWSAVNANSPPFKSKCVDAVSELAARNQCQLDCGAYKMDMEETCADDATCDLVAGIDCNLDGSYINSDGMAIVGDPEGEQPVKKSLLTGWECDGEPVKVNEGPFKHFEGSATLVTPQGVSAGVGSFRGYLGYKLSGCTPSTCTVTIDTLVGLTRAVEGGYSDAAGMGGLFEVQQMGFQSTVPFTGTWNRSRKTVTFPDAVMSNQFWASAVLVDGIPVTSGYGAYTVETSQVVGTLITDDGPLALNFVLDLPLSGVVSVSLRTLPPS